MIFFTGKLVRYLQDKELHCKTFTIIELLVVITIITILASLIMPALKNARESGRQVLCASNLKQQGQAIYEYAGDYNDRFPQRLTYSVIWGLQLLPYINNKVTFISDAKVFSCPVLNPLQSHVNFMQAYSMNEFLSTGITKPLPLPRMNQIKRPSNVLLVSDSNTYPTGTSWWPAEYCYAISDINYINGINPLGCTPGTRHLQKANVIFVDGHVNSIHRDQLSDNYKVIFDYNL